MAKSESLSLEIRRGTNSRGKEVEEVTYRGRKYRRFPFARAQTQRCYFRWVGRDKEGINEFRVLHRDIWEDAFGPIQKGCHIHHKDGNPTNNDLDNLECLGMSEHLRMHKLSLPFSDRVCQRCGATYSSRATCIAKYCSVKCRKKEEYKREKERLNARGR